jgi:hypothetical protein
VDPRESGLTRGFSVDAGVSPVLIAPIISAQFRYIKKLGQESTNPGQSSGFEIFKSGKTRTPCYEFRNR